jgi:hypothetical protein
VSKTFVILVCDRNSKSIVHRILAFYLLTMYRSFVRAEACRAKTESVRVRLRKHDRSGRRCDEDRAVKIVVLAGPAHRFAVHQTTLAVTPASCRIPPGSHSNYGCGAIVEIPC